MSFNLHDLHHLKLFFPHVYHSVDHNFLGGVITLQYCASFCCSLLESSLCSVKSVVLQIMYFFLCIEFDHFHGVIPRSDNSRLSLHLLTGR